jgi:hypothetical protein
LKAFGWIAVPLAMIFGLGITRLLMSGVAVFRSRGRAELDWIPIAWAACTFILLLQYWWAVIELTALIEIWSLEKFLLLLGLSLLLFVAAALVLPHKGLRKGRSLSESFNRDGRWALCFLSGYFLLAMATNWLLWDVSPISLPSGLMFILALLPLAFLVIPSRRGREVITVLFVCLSFWTSWELSPKSY